MFRGLLSLALCLLAMALLVGASPSQEKKDKIKGQLPPGWKDLDLTPAQKEEVYKINAEYKAKIDELTKKIKELEAERNQARLKVLTEAQRQKLAKLVTGEDAKDSKKKTDK
ncbi:MAG: hypothetical protein NZO58_06885 [Gemmataceae bacterium]|nr:hypothetical protein [Gemmataceae bacterium]